MEIEPKREDFPDYSSEDEECYQALSQEYEESNWTADIDWDMCYMELSEEDYAEEHAQWTTFEEIVLSWVY